MCCSSICLPDQSPSFEDGFCCDTLSTLPLKPLIWSAPEPGANTWRSAPVPPVMVSLFSLPQIVSLPEPATIKSLPKPPKIRFAPSLEVIVSPSSFPRMMSLPAPLAMVSVARRFGESRDTET